MAHNKANEFDSTRVTFAACLLSLLSLFPLQCFLRQCKTTFLTFLVREGARLRERRLNWRLRSCTGVVVTCSKSRRKFFFHIWSIFSFCLSFARFHAIKQGLLARFWDLLLTTEKEKEKAKANFWLRKLRRCDQANVVFCSKHFSVKQLQQIVRPPRVCIINERFV